MKLTAPKLPSFCESRIAWRSTFRAEGSFVALPPVPEAALEKGFQQAFLARAEAISAGLREKLLGWTHTGFSVHDQVRVNDAQGRSQLARYMLRAPVALEWRT